VVTLAYAYSVAMGLSDGPALRALVPLINDARERCLGGDLRLQQGHSEKWFGSQDLMWDLTRDYAKTSPEWLCLIAAAHMEDWNYYTAFRNAEPGDVETWRERFNAPDYIDSFLELQAKFLDGIADHPPSTTLTLAHNVMGAAMAHLVSYASARPHLEAIGPLVHRPSWCHLLESDDPMDHLNRVRRRIGMKGLFA
jgi:hypothetical protein